MEGKEGRKKGARKRFCDGTCDSSRLFKVLPYLSCAAALFGVSASMALWTPMEAKLANQRWDGLSFPQAEAPKLRSRPTRNCPCLLFGNFGKLCERRYNSASKHHDNPQAPAEATNHTETLHIPTLWRTDTRSPSQHSPPGKPDSRLWISDGN